MVRACLIGTQPRGSQVNELRGLGGDDLRILKESLKYEPDDRRGLSLMRLVFQGVDLLKCDPRIQWGKNKR